MVVPLSIPAFWLTLLLALGHSRSVKRSVKLSYLSIRLLIRIFATVQSLISINFYFASEPSSAPQGITRLKINETTYNITWQPLSQEKSNGRILTYEVKRSEVSASRQKRSLPSFYKNTTATFFVLFNLKVCTKYEVEVRAYTTAGPGSFGATDHPIETSGICFFLF